MSDKRSPIYYYSFNTDKENKTIAKVKGVQFVEQELNIEADDAEFLTLQAADDDGYMKDFQRCFPAWKMVEELAKLPDKVMVSKIRELRQRARNIIK